MKNKPQSIAFCCLFWLCLSFSVFPAVGRCSPALPYPLSPADENVGLPDNTVWLIRKMSPEQQQRQFQYLLTQGVVVNLPGFWKIMQQPEDIVTAVQSFGEPFNVNMLDALERALPNLRQQNQQIQAACWLFRYGRKSGYQYLVQSLDGPFSQAVEAAETLALNHDENTKKQVLAFYLKNPDNSAGLISILGDWHEDDVKATLVQAFRERPRDSHLALALGKQQVREAAPQIRDLYFGSSANDPSKVYAGAALVALDGPKASQIFEFLAALIKQPSSVDLKAVAIQALSQVREQRAVPLLIKVVDDYNQHPGQSGPKNSAISEDRFALMAGEGLAHMGAVRALPSIVRLIGTLKKSGTNDSLSARAAIAALSLGEDRTAAAKFMGKRWVSIHLYEASLKPIPGSLLPDPIF